MDKKAKKGDFEGFSLIVCAFRPQKF